MMHNKLNDYQYSGMLSVLYHTIKSHFSCVLLYPLHMKDFDQIYKPQKDFVMVYITYDCWYMYLVETLFI